MGCGHLSYIPKWGVVTCLIYRNGVWSFVLYTEMGCGHLSWIPKQGVVSGPDNNLQQLQNTDEVPRRLT